MEILTQKAAQIDQFIREFLKQEPVSRYVGMRTLQESISYSLLQGGKRFRPALALMTAEALEQPVERILPFAASVEFIHTYSLIHDDLPCMDNDDFRRGQPTNHKIHGEAMALLAGDALLTDSFYLLASRYADVPAAVRVILELSEAAGLRGMVGGQAIDIQSKVEDVTLEELEVMHRMKTGALIRVSVTGAALLCGADADQLNQLRTYAESLGLAFQVADDLLDHDPSQPEAGSYPALIGVAQTREYLDELTTVALGSLQSWTPSADPLRELAKFNKLRTH